MPWLVPLYMILALAPATTATEQARFVFWHQIVRFFGSPAALIALVVMLVVILGVALYGAVRRIGAAANDDPRHSSCSAPGLGRFTVCRREPAEVARTL